MRFILDIIKGILMGIANIIPGVSGGTMAVSLGIFDRLISSITHLFKDFKKSISTLVPILLGLAIGIIGFSYAVEYLLKAHTLATCLAFVGLILGGLPVLLLEMKDGLQSQGGDVYKRQFLFSPANGLNPVNNTFIVLLLLIVIKNIHPILFYALLFYYILEKIANTH